MAHDDVSFHGLPSVLSRVTAVRSYRICQTVEELRRLLDDASFNVAVLPVQVYSGHVHDWITRPEIRYVLTSTDAPPPSLESLNVGTEGPVARIRQQQMSLHTLQNLFDRLADESPEPSLSSVDQPAAARLTRARARITKRERLVLILLAKGRSNQQIAHALGISIHGVKRHVSNLLIKLDCSNRTEIALKVIQLGITTEE